MVTNIRPITITILPTQHQYTNTIPITKLIMISHNTNTKACNNHNNNDNQIKHNNNNTTKKQ